MFGFTKNELKVLLFLSVGFLAGGTVKMVQDHWQSLPEPARGGILKDVREPDVMTVASLRGEAAETAGFYTVPLNSATEKDLERIPGIGPVTARRILSYRDANGGFKTVEELLNVKGIGQKKMQKIRPHISIQ